MAINRHQYRIVFFHAVSVKSDYLIFCCPFLDRESLVTLLTRFQCEKLGDEDTDLQIIRVRRKHLWEDTVRSISKNAFKQNHSLKFHFIGEEAQDEGGPKRDFLRLAMTAVCNHSGVLQGLECRKTFSNNPLLLERKAYYCASLVTGMSLQQGGPGLHCLSPSLFDYFVAGPSSSRVIPLDVADHDTRKKIEKVKLADARLHELMITRK